MKRCLILIILSCILLYPISALAEHPQECMLLDSGIDYATYPEYPEQYCYLPVTILIDTADGDTIPSPVSMHVATITYKYDVFVDSGVYTGIRIGGDPYPKVAAVKPASFPITPVVTKVSNPPRKDFNLSDYSYSITIAGGLITIEYVNVLHYDVNMNLIDYETTTVQRTFYLQDSGPKDGHNIGG